MKRFIFSVQVDHVLDADQIWPPGEAPEDPTAEDARQAFLYCCGNDVNDGLREWGLVPTRHDLTVTELEDGVTFNGK